MPAVPPEQETGTTWCPCPSVILNAKLSKIDKVDVLPEGNQDSWSQHESWLFYLTLRLTGS